MRCESNVWVKDQEIFTANHMVHGVHSLHNNCAVLLYTGIHSDGTGVKCGVRVMCG